MLSLSGLFAKRLLTSGAVLTGNKLKITLSKDRFDPRYCDAFSQFYKIKSIKIDSLQKRRVLLNALFVL